MLRESLNNLASAFQGAALKQLEVTLSKDHQGRTRCRVALAAETPGSDGNPEVQYKAEGQGKSIDEALSVAVQQANSQAGVVAMVQRSAG